MIGRVLGSVAIAVLATGCSSIIEGTSQTLSFTSNPAGANCILTRNGLTIGNVTTPSGLVIEKTKHNIQVVCSKEGYDDSTVMLKSGTAGATFGNIILGGGIGWAIDSASGADNKYDDVVNVFLNRKGDPRATEKKSSEG
ncbi:MAG: PEGA domain-containing protein [Rhodospirillaceae bacterium]|nr:PEGA domain-containing protein [Rhodospirillales bacterium]